MDLSSPQPRPRSALRPWRRCPREVPQHHLPRLRPRPGCRHRGVPGLRTAPPSSSQAARAGSGCSPGRRPAPGASAGRLGGLPSMSLFSTWREGFSGDRHIGAGYPGRRSWGGRLGLKPPPRRPSLYAPVEMTTRGACAACAAARRSPRSEKLSASGHRCAGWIRTTDLRVMSPPSYRTAPPRSVARQRVDVTLVALGHYTLAHPPHLPRRRQRKPVLRRRAAHRHSTQTPCFTIVIRDTSPAFAVRLSSASSR